MRNQQVLIQDGTKKLIDRAIEHYVESNKRQCGDVGIVLSKKLTNDVSIRADKHVSREAESKK